MGQCGHDIIKHPGLFQIIIVMPSLLYFLRAPRESAVQFEGVVRQML